MKAKHSKSKIWLSISLLLMLISMIGASNVQSSGGAVEVQDFRVIVDNGYYVNGQIYIPEKASPENQLPLIVLSHGSYNNFEMQDQNMIELSRRGFVVISSDAYNHGSSSIKVDPSDSFSNMIHIIDYAVSSLTFIDPSKIAVSGHSMGGMIASMTVQHYFQQEALGLGEKKLAAILDVGYDGIYEPYTFEGLENPVEADIDWGILGAKYDEWFFKSEDVNYNPARFLESNNARSFINQTGAGVTGPVENGKIYEGLINGKSCIRAIYQNTEIHPQNHFSKASAASAISFFYASLGVPSGYSILAEKNQIWPWKEFFNLLGLIGIFLFLFPFSVMLIKNVSFFSELKEEKLPPPAPALTTSKSRLVFWGTYAMNLIIPALLVMPVMFHLVGKESFVPFTITKWFGEPNTNELASWTAIVALALLTVFLLSFHIFGKKSGASINSWGIKISIKKLWKSFLLALTVIASAYVILFFADLCFNTDFRIWMIAMRIFTVDKILFAIAYFPAFALFYLVNSLLVNGGNRLEGMNDWMVTLISCISNIAGISLLIFIQYNGIISNGTFIFNSMRIVNLFPLVVLIPLGTIITRKFFKETGTIYTGSFIIAMLYTMMTCANTMVLGSILY